MRIINLGASPTWAYHQPGRITNLGVSPTWAYHQLGRITNLGVSPTWAHHSPTLAKSNNIPIYDISL
jgi:hypothetical protein